MLTSPTHAPRRALATMRVQGGVESNLDAPRVLHRRPDTYCDHQVPIPPPGPPCPRCSQPTVQGFGLAGGGYGAYEYCETPDCGYFSKTQEFPEDWE